MSFNCRTNKVFIKYFRENISEILKQNELPEIMSKTWENQIRLFDEWIDGDISDDFDRHLEDLKNCLSNLQVFYLYLECNKTTKIK